ncbi:MAG: adenosylmethionine decarboxylase [Nanoarchaeota archaeon]|nr:adenosylmethionine decarboxylase [Nanoarchaeota archaeon]
MKTIHGLCNIKKLHNLGNHLIIDGYSSSKEILADEDFIRNFIRKLVSQVEMTPISKPLIVKYNSKDPHQNGVTGTIILAESNITIHTYPHYNFFCLDLFSCSEFKIDKTIDYLISELKITKYKKKLIKRGFYDEEN